MADIPIAVFDCGVFLQGLMSKTGPAKAYLELVENNDVRLVMSEAILAEIKDVISRTHLKKLSRYLTDEKAEALIDLILEKAEFVENVGQHFIYPRDKTDEPYLNLAIETGAGFLIARDRDLLNLMTDHSDEAKEFRQRFRRLKIVSPAEFLRIVREMGLGLNP